MISVIVPTITGREHWLGACVAAYQETAPGRLEIVVVKDRETCGLAWQAGADRAQGDYLHFTADDIVPHPGWWKAAVECVGTGAIPSARILNGDGTLQSSGAWGVDAEEGTVTDIARVPFCSRKQWASIGPSLETHYFTDNWFAHRASLAGIPTVVCRDYLFTHHYAPEGRLDARMGPDLEVYRRMVAA